MKNLDLNNLDLGNIKVSNPFKNLANGANQPVAQGSTAPVINETKEEVKVDMKKTNEVSEMFSQVAESVKKNKVEGESKGDTVQVSSLPNSSVLSINKIVDKLNLIEKDMNSIFVEREDIISSIILAVASKQHVLLVGEPGTGKSAIINNFAERISDANTFNWQLTRTTDPSELFGPISIKDMENDKFRRKTEGTLLDCHIAYLDETFKANSAILNSLLQLMNERTFNNDGQRIKCPLLSIFGSSNEWGEDESLEAFTDRFVFKHEVKYISKSKNLTKLLKNKANGIKNTYTGKLTLDEINFIHSEADKVTVLNDAIDALTNLISELKANENQISDRKACQCLDIMKAHAILKGRRAVTTADLKALTYVLWDGESNISDLKDIIAGYSNPYAKQYEELAKEYNALVKKFFKFNTVEEKTEFITSNMPAISSVITLVGDAIKELDVNDGAYAEFRAVLDSCTNFKLFLVNYLSDSNTAGKQKDFAVKARMD